MRSPSSPVTDGPCHVVASRPVDEIAALYQATFGIDIRSSFRGLDKIKLCQCVETGYRFYYPHDVAGDPTFYETLYSRQENRSWSYQTEKWEFERTLALMQNSVSDLLDVGSGAGDFLMLAENHAAARTGLETSPFGLAEAKRKGLTVLDRTIEDYAAENPGQHDMITAFQVLEHIPDVRGFITSCIHALKPGGQLVVAVPNNGGFVGKQMDLPLNMPPHHVGLWDRESLGNIAGVFDLHLVGIECEPLADENVGWYTALMEDLYLPRSRIARSLFHRLGFHEFFIRYVRENRHSIHGHTIMAVYRKPDSSSG